MRLVCWIALFGAQIMTALCSTQQSILNITDSVTSAPLCRDRSKYTDPHTFRLKSCAECYRYLFPSQRIYRFYKDYYMVVMSRRIVNGTTVTDFKVTVPDIDNSTIKADICASLDEDDCERWAQCCLSAVHCCDKQRSSGPTPSGMCPQTWDGFSCWDSANPGTIVTEKCPSFLEHANPLDRARKICTTNGTWFVHESGLEWTNYTQCLDITKHKFVTYISIACELASLALLVPAVIVFLSYRPLRKQHRVRLHVHLFISFMLTGVIYILWATLVVLDRVDTPKKESVMYRNSPGCKFLYALTRYARACNYMWVLCEGFYLHRLIVKTFEPPKQLLVYYIVGWGFPWIPVGIYSILRIYYSDKNCWVSHVRGLEWIIYTPNLACLVINLIFLSNILRILVTQLQSHPNEPSNFRKALKATFILIPLFGLQLILIIYRPPFNSSVSRVYEIAAAIITHSQEFSSVLSALIYDETYPSILNWLPGIEPVEDTQGFFVSLIFCFINGEVLAHLRKTWVGVCGIKLKRDKRYDSSSTQITTDFNSRSHVSRGPGGSTRNYIQMKAIDDDIGDARLYN